MDKITQLREDTYQETKELLATYHKCAIIRPTGFGKTGILTRLIRDHNHVLYLYPTEVVKNAVLNFYYNNNIPDDKQIPNVTFLTYHGLAIAKPEKLKSFQNIDLIIADECHKLGGKLTLKAMQHLLELHPTADLCGATATPERMDLIDEISLFFDNHTTSIYTLHDAFQDGILKRPYYCFCAYDTDHMLKETEKSVRLEIDKETDKNNRKQMMDLMKANLIEISNITQMDHIIHATCEEVLSDTSYMKFIVFCRNLKSTHEQSKKVQNWFTTAYPNHEIRTLTINSEKEEYQKNTERLPELSYKKNTIDLIFCCDMLNMGYHVNNLTGILMYRGTESGIIYAQQLGRVLSSGNKLPGIVFDVVDNLHRESMYEVLGHTSEKTENKKARFRELQWQVQMYQETNDSSYKLSSDEFKEYRELKQFMQNYARRGGNQNALQPEDLIATKFEATYRELIAKTVAEPVSMRCRQAYAYWKERGGDDSTFTPEYVLSRQSPDAVPLLPFAWLKKVSVEGILNEIFGPGDYHELVAQYCH